MFWNHSGLYQVLPVLFIKGTVLEKVAMSGVKSLKILWMISDSSLKYNQFKKNIMKIKTTVMSLIVLTLMSCNTGKNIVSETSDSANSIENSKWVITTLEGQDLSNIESPNQKIYFTLDSETNRVNGYSGCNTFMGTYTLEAGNRISFSQMATTRMACPESEISESDILSVFETADNFTLNGNQLSLNKAKRAPLAEFKRAQADAEIVEKYWKLKTLEGKDVQMVDNQEREIFFTLKTNDNQLTGFSGCNSFSGQYSLEEGNRIRFSQIATTMKACPDVDINESEFLQIFELADNYTIKDDELSLNVGRRAPLAVFEAVYF